MLSTSFKFSKKDTPCNCADAKQTTDVGVCIYINEWINMNEWMNEWIVSRCVLKVLCLVCDTDGKMNLCSYYTEI